MTSYYVLALVSHAPPWANIKYHETSRTSITTTTTNNSRSFKRLSHIAAASTQLSLLMLVLVWCVPLLNVISPCFLLLCNYAFRNLVIWLIPSASAMWSSIPTPFTTYANWAGADLGKGGWCVSLPISKRRTHDPWLINSWYTSSTRWKEQ
jgi:hypothetical protein